MDWNRLKISGDKMENKDKKVIMGIYLIESSVEARSYLKGEDVESAEKERTSLIECLDKLCPYEPAQEAINYLKEKQWLTIQDIDNTDEVLSGLMEKLENAN